MSRIKAKKIVKEYAETLKDKGYVFSAIYLFGSHAKGKTRQWSDIDVAVVSDKLKRNRDENENLLWHIRRQVDSMIEPHAFTKKDFQDRTDPMVHEIRTTGIRIA